MQEKHCGPVGGPSFGVRHAEDASIDLLQRAESVCPRLNRGCRRVRTAGLCCSRTNHPELRDGRSYCGGPDETASMLVDPIHHLDCTHRAASEADQPNVKAKTSTLGLRNSIS